ncbi:MAG: hypothetical protein KKH85_01875 [Proteobacteria bacterium]|nr:hypothetical protein [Pseudomonadota bacterium]
MKNMILSLLFLFAFSFSVLAASPGDVLDKAKEDIESLNKFALSIHNKAAADIEDFHENLLRIEGPPQPKIHEMLAAGIPPWDVFMMAHISILSGKPVSAVHEEYKRSKGQGWGVIAKEMGIKPGSTAFHNLKEKFKREVDRKSSRKLKNKGADSGSHGKGAGKGKKIKAGIRP